MKILELAKICDKAGRRPQIVISDDAAAVILPGLEGRIFYCYKDEVISLFRPESVVNFSDGHEGYFNPGGDGLWPAPEGTCFGYEYSTGKWRVPMGLVNIQYKVTYHVPDHLIMVGEADLINNRQLGIPVTFIREIFVYTLKGKAYFSQDDMIAYDGKRTLRSNEFSLAPWSLCQFKVTPDARASFKAFPGKIRDLYDDSTPYLEKKGNRMEFKPNKKHRIQLGLPEEAEFLELVLPKQNVKITRFGDPLDEKLTQVDIADAPVDTRPQSPVRYSIYNDPSGFMELEIVGGCQFPLKPGTVLRMGSTTVIESLK